jgi:DNA polymerase-3 subunit epsilon
MREIVLDTETTGLDANADRIVEIGCVEVINHIPTGRNFHVYLKPDVKMSAEAERIHGLSEAFLADKPSFAAVAAEFTAFIDGASLVAHNANFDFAFLNAELGRNGHRTIGSGRIVDTLMLARRRHPGSPVSLDALCSRYGIDTSKRTFHGALLDAQLLAEVYVELQGGRQAALGLTQIVREDGAAALDVVMPVAPRAEPRLPTVAETEWAAHAALIKTLGGAPLWSAYLPGEASAAA